MPYYRRHYGGQTAKYNNQKVIIDDIRFDSRKEANRYCQLKLLQKGNVISNLELQKKFVLIPAQYAADETITLKSGKTKTVKGKCLEREVAYFADFAYTDNKTGEYIVEDTKSPITRTKEYIIKRKLMLERYGIRINEI